MAIKKSKRGRPALPEGTSKSEIVKIKVTPAEVVIIDSVAARHGLSRSEVMRRAIKLLDFFPEMMPPEPRWLEHPDRRYRNFDVNLPPPPRQKKEPTP